MWIGVISLFPDMLNAITNYGITGKAIKRGLLKIESWNPRDFTENKSHSVDARPYGGGPGMIMTVHPLQHAIYAAKKKYKESNIKVIYLSPQGRVLNQKKICTLAKKKKIILVCGRYKGIDERLINTEIDEELSIGDYVLSGGEIPAMVLIDAIARFVPGILNKSSSAENDSFFHGLLDCPHYTRPKISKGISVPSILLSGNHAKIQRWRMKESIGRTWIKRPELLNKILLTKEQKKLLSSFKKEFFKKNN